MTKPSLIVYGNCQGSALASILRVMPFVAERFEIRYVSSFEPSLPEQPTTEEIARCAMLYEQHDPSPFPHRDLLPPACRTVVYPAIDFNLLWPWGAPSPCATPEPPEFPHGRFPYGDAILMRCIENGMDVNAIVRYYRDRAWQEHQPPVERLISLEHARLEAREKHCDIKIAAYVFDRFRDTRLHWTANHPTTAALCEVALRLARATFPEALDFERSELVYRAQLSLKEPLEGRSACPSIRKSLARSHCAGTARTPPIRTTAASSNGAWRSMCEPTSSATPFESMRDSLKADRDEDEGQLATVGAKAESFRNDAHLRANAQDERTRRADERRGYRPSQKVHAGTQASTGPQAERRTADSADRHGEALGAPLEKPPPWNVQRDLQLARRPHRFDPQSRARRDLSSMPARWLPARDPVPSSQSGERRTVGDHDPRRHHVCVRGRTPRMRRVDRMIVMPARGGRAERAEKDASSSRP